MATPNDYLHLAPPSLSALDSPIEMRQLVLDYLTNSAYPDSAQALAREIHLNSLVDLTPPSAEPEPMQIDSSTTTQDHSPLLSTKALQLVRLRRGTALPFSLFRCQNPLEIGY